MRGAVAEELTDNQLMASVREGEVRNLAVLFERHHRALFLFFLRLAGDRGAAEDLVQDVFFRILKYRQTYYAGAPFTTWMFQVARNVFLDSRKRRREEQLPEDAEGNLFLEPRHPAPHAEEQLSRKQEIGLLKRALDRLPLEKREVLIMSRFQEMKYDQIASILMCDVGAVKVRVFRAIRELGAIYEQLASERAS
jgi:RNA polymerase sigma-70 factor, ECF subfamily